MATLIVAGGGIGGLAAALAAAAQGHRVTVLERREQFTELGAGIQLAPNAYHALDRLGVGTAVRGRSVYVDELRFMDGVSGRKVAALPLGHAYRERFGNPYAVVHRADLFEPLLEACRRHALVRLRPASSVRSYRQDENGVVVLLESGEQLRADALLGADGIRSTVRSQMLGDGEPRVSGHTIYRSVIPMELVPERLRSNAVTLWAGPGWHVVHYPIGEGRLLNLAATRDDGAVEAVAGVPVESAHVLGCFPGLDRAARTLLELGRDWRSWVLCDRDPVQRWAEGRVLLLGDAAHPMLQYAAQGACQALEDAVHLGCLLVDAAADELPAVFRAFEEGRTGRAGRAQLVARAMGTELYHPAGERAASRNAALGALSEDELYRKVGWLHGAREFAASPVPG